MSDKEIWLLSHPTQYDLAEKIEMASNRCITFKKLIRWKKFENNYPNLFIENVKKLIGREIIFVCNLSTPDLMFEQLSIMNALPKYLIASLTILVPFFPCGTMEKIEREGQIATAKTTANLLSAIPMCKYGPAQMVIYDIHALQERFYFGDSIIPRLESAIPLLYKEIDTILMDDSIQSICIVFPDDGARKRFSTMFTCSQWQQQKTLSSKDIVCRDQSDQSVKYVDRILICSKTRLDNGCYDMELIGKIPNKCHVVIVDDLINTGGTVHECAKKCFENGAIKVSVFVSHGLFPNESWRKFQQPILKPISQADKQDYHLSNFWISDSIPHKDDIFAENEAGIFKLCSMASIFAHLFV